MTGKTTNARVQSFYRDVNERIVSVSRGLEDGASLEILCECGTASCVERIRITVDDYEALRGKPTHFALVDGHQDQAVEDVVARRPGYLIVANHGRAGTHARRTDPRSSSR